MSWSTRFPIPITIPGFDSLWVLSDARDYILALPNTEQAEERWQSAMDALQRAVTGDGKSIVLARNGIIDGMRSRPR